MWKINYCNIIYRVCISHLRMLSLGVCLLLFAIFITGCKPQGTLAMKQRTSSLNEKLFLPASQGNVKEVKALLDSGADVNSKEAEGETPLMYAAAEGHTEIVLLLLRRGADIHKHSVNDQTALGRAAMYGHADTVEMLLNHGAKVDEQMDQGGTPLMHAANVPTAKVLLSHGAKVNAQNHFGFTALMGAAAEGKIDIVNLLVAAGADTTLTDNGGRTALQWAIERDHTDVAAILGRK